MLPIPAPSSTIEKLTYSLFNASEWKNLVAYNGLFRKSSECIILNNLTSPLKVSISLQFVTIEEHRLDCIYSLLKIGETQAILTIPKAFFLSWIESAEKSSYYKGNSHLVTETTLDLTNLLTTDVALIEYLSDFVGPDDRIHHMLGLEETRMFVYNLKSYHNIMAKLHDQPIPFPDHIY
jgi:hypothetical protein